MLTGIEKLHIWSRMKSKDAMSHADHYFMKYLHYEYLMKKFFWMSLANSRQSHETHWVSQMGRQLVVVQSASHGQLSVTPWTKALQASLPLTVHCNFPRFMCTELVIPSNHLIICCPLLFLPSVFPSIRVFSNELAAHIRWPKYWRFSFSIHPSDIPWCFRVDFL